MTVRRVDHNHVDFGFDEFFRAFKLTYTHRRSNAQSSTRIATCIRMRAHILKIAHRDETLEATLSVDEEQFLHAGLAHHPLCVGGLRFTRRRDEV